MAFNSLVEDTKRMNAKMIAMGQSVDIQKMPRPKPGSIATQKATYTPEGSDIEKMLYPKNFKPITYETEKGEHATITQPNPNTEELIEKAMEEQTNQQTITDYQKNDAIVIEAKPQEEKNPEELMQKCFAPPWKKCKHYKEQGQRAFCKEYLGWCAKEKCSRPYV